MKLRHDCVLGLKHGERPPAPSPGIPDIGEIPRVRWPLCPAGVFGKDGRWTDSILRERDMRTTTARTLFAAALALATPALADGPITVTVDDSFDNVAFAVEDAIVARGLVVDHVSHVGEMLARTKADVGGTKDVFTQANVYQFCSASTSRKVMEVNPLNIQFCPYGIFVAEMPDAPGKIIVGYNQYPAGEMQEVQELLKSIVDEAVGG